MAKIRFTEEDFPFELEGYPEETKALKNKIVESANKKLFQVENHKSYSDLEPGEIMVGGRACGWNEEEIKTLRERLNGKV